MIKLTTTDHGRDKSGLQYVYSVLSRRSGGLSIGVNLNPNHACNWRCLYCQVPDLVRGAGVPIDLERFEEELRGLLDDVLRGDFYDRFELPSDKRIIRDVAIAGDGEPTTSPDFDAAIGVIGRVVADYDLFDQIKRVLITNGSQMQKAEVQRGLAHWSELGGRVWFKVDRATPEGISRINQVSLSPARMRENLEISARICPTWIQTCLFALDGEPPSESEQRAYLDLLASLPDDGIFLEGVLLYGLARPSRQPEADRLTALPGEWLLRFGERVRGLGMDCQVHV